MHRVGLSGPITHPINAYFGTMLFETTRLIVEMITPAHRDFYLELLNSPGFIQNIADRGIRTPEAAETAIREKVLNHHRAHGYGFYLMTLKADRTPIGICGFVKRDFLAHTDIGYAILPQYEGQGYTFEAASAMKEYGRKTWGLDPIQGIVNENNTASRRLLEKLGLREIGTVIIPDDGDEVVLYSNATPSE